MNEGLEALERLYNESNRDFGWEREEQHKKDKAVIEKELKALEIIKNKNVSAYGIKYTKNVHDYNLSYASKGKEQLIQEEYDLLKEVLMED